MKVLRIAVLLLAAIHLVTGSAQAKTKSKRKSGKQSRSSAVQASRESNSATAVPDGVAMSGGKVAIISNKIATTVDTEVSANRMKVWPNGDVQLADGRKLHLEEGQLVTHEGKVLTLPARPKITWKQGSDNPQNSAPLPKK